MKEFFNKHYLFFIRLVYCSVIILFLNIFNPTIVHGSSMQPTLSSGDTLFLNTLDKTVEVGDIVVIEPLPVFCGNSVIKRVTQIKDDKIWIEGDNKENSFDSRDVGWIPIESVLGVVIL